MPVASSERSPLASLPSHSNTQSYGRGNRQAAAVHDEEKGGSDGVAAGAGGGKGLTAASAAAGPGLGKDRRTAAAAGDAAADSLTQQQRHTSGAEVETEADSQQELGYDAAGGLAMQGDDSSAALSLPPLSSQLSGGGVGAGGGSHKRKKKGAVGLKRAAIVGAAAASAAAKAERKAGGPLDGAADTAAAPAVPAPRGGNVQPGQGGTRKRKQKEVSHLLAPPIIDHPACLPTRTAQSSHTCSAHLQAMPALGCRERSWLIAVLWSAVLVVVLHRRRLWWSLLTCSLCCPSV